VYVFTKEELSMLKTSSDIVKSLDKINKTLERLDIN